MVDVKEDYKVSQVADFFGITPDTVRLYDKMGILSPRKSETSNYRRYTWAELLAMDYIMQLKSMNVPLNEIQHYINDYDVKETITSLKQQEQQLERELEEIYTAKKRVKAYIDVLEEGSRRVDDYEFTMSPRIIWCQVDKYVKGIKESFKKLSTSQIPCFTFMIDKEKLMEHKDDSIAVYKETLRTEINHGISIFDYSNLAAEMLVADSSKIQICEPKLALHTYRLVDIDGEFPTLKDILRIIDEHDYELDGEIFTMMPASFHQADSVVTFYEFWAPVKEKVSQTLE